MAGLVIVVLFANRSFQAREFTQEDAVQNLFGLVLLIGIVSLIVFGISRFSHRLRRDQEARDTDYHRFAAGQCVSAAVNALLMYLSNKPLAFWPTPDQLRAYVMDDTWLVRNPFSGERELIIVVAGSLAGSNLSGRTIIQLVGPGQVIVQTLDQNGIDSLVMMELPKKYFPGLPETKAS